MITQGRTTGRIIKKGVDEMGRFTWMILKGKNERQIMTITVYRVYKAGPNIGPHTAHMQQIKQLLMKEVTTPDPRREILGDIQRLVKEQHKQGGGVVLMMDANEDWERDGELAEFLLETQLEDVHQSQQQTTPTTTYSRGTKRLDYIFTSHPLLGTIRMPGYLAIHDAIISDHRMCYMDVNMITFLGGNINQILRPYQRIFKCNKKQEANYLYRN